MNPAQANALLQLIADLARIVYTPPPAQPEPVVSTNGQTAEKVAATQ